MTKTIATITAVGALAAAATPAAAADVAYQGKTKGGHTITFKRSGSKIRSISSAVPVVCATSSGGAFDTKAGADIYQPPGKFALGQAVKRKAMQRTPFYPAKVTKNYTVTTAAKKNGKVTGKLDENFSYSILGLDLYGNSYIRIYICQGVTTFTASPK
jgi:hypothetical protein